jgi:translocation and assembly module TamB
MGKTRKLLNVDEIEVSEAEEGSGTQVGVGKYVSDDVYLKVEKSLNTDSGRVIVEVELTPSLTIESDVGTDQKTGIGVRWKHHY